MQMPTLTRIATGAAVVLAAMVGCTDLGVEPKSTVTGANIFNDPSSYRAFIARIYAGLQVTGQEGPAGRPDISSPDEGFTQYIRLYWQMQELPTDEVGIAWGDDGVQQLNTQIWGSSNQFLVNMYYRVFFQVSLVNEFLRETSNDKLNQRGVSAELRTQIAQYRAEARYLRALSYWHGLDLFGRIPLVTEANALGSNPPPQAERAALFAYVESELLAIRSELPPRGEYGRADQGAVNMLLAKLYLNAEVYTGSPRYTDARVATEAVIAGGYSLDNNYREIFLADNHTSPEIIFGIPQDGEKTQSYGGTTFLIHASVGGNFMPAAPYGINGGWWGLRAKPELVAKFAGGPDGPDGRSAFFYTNQQSLAMNSLTDWYSGYALPKFQNVTSTGAPGKNDNFTDTDFPMFRLADAYLMYAEAVLRGGGGSRATALSYVNAIRARAYGDNSGAIADAQLTLDFILDERARELMWEGHRRQDLIRFDMFTDNGIWSWKGNVAAGRTTEPFRDLYPLPASELLANPSLTQNPGYGS